MKNDSSISGVHAHICRMDARHVNFTKYFIISKIISLNKIKSNKIKFLEAIELVPNDMTAIKMI